MQYLSSSEGASWTDTDFTGVEDSAWACPVAGGNNFACLYIRIRRKRNNLPFHECRDRSASGMSAKVHEPCAYRLLTEGYWKR